MKQLVLVLCLITALSAFAQMPRTLNYQGTLTSGSKPVPDGNYNVTFRLYTVASSGSAVWTEAQLVTTRNGVFNAILGKVVSLPPSFDTPYWMSLQVGAEAELSPRLEMTGVSYSMHSPVADSSKKVANGSIATASLAAGAVTAEKIADGAVNSATILDHSILGTDIAGSTIMGSNILDEPGVSTSTNGYHVLGSGNIKYVLDSVEILLHYTGYVVLFASGFVPLHHTSGGETGVGLGISDDKVTLPVGYSYMYLPPTLATQVYTIPFSTHSFFYRKEGRYTFYLIAHYNVGSDTKTEVSQTRLTAMYFPTMLGTSN